MFALRLPRNHRKRKKNRKPNHKTRWLPLRDRDKHSMCQGTIPISNQPCSPIQPRQHILFKSVTKRFTKCSQCNLNKLCSKLCSAQHRFKTIQTWLIRTLPKSPTVGPKIFHYKFRMWIKSLILLKFPLPHAGRTRQLTTSVMFDTIIVNIL